MISLYSTGWIEPGNEKKVIPALNKLVNDVKKKEPGPMRYRVCVDKKSSPTPFYNSEPVQRPGTVVFGLSKKITENNLCKGQKKKANPNHFFKLFFWMILKAFSGNQRKMLAKEK